MSMFLAGLFTGAVTGSALGIGLISLMTVGKWADEKLEYAVRRETEESVRTPEENTEESRVNGCGNETM